MAAGRAGARREAENGIRLYRRVQSEGRIPFRCLDGVDSTPRYHAGIPDVSSVPDA